MGPRLTGGVSWGYFPRLRVGWRRSSAVEQGNHNPLVGGSNPPAATIPKRPPRSWGASSTAGSNARPIHWMVYDALPGNARQVGGDPTEPVRRRCVILTSGPGELNNPIPDDRLHLTHPGL